MLITIWINCFAVLKYVAKLCLQNSFIDQAIQKLAFMGPMTGKSLQSLILIFQRNLMIWL